MMVFGNVKDNADAENGRRNLGCGWITILAVAQDCNLLLYEEWDHSGSRQRQSEKKIN